MLTGLRGYLCQLDMVTSLGQGAQAWFMGFSSGETIKRIYKGDLNKVWYPMHGACMSRKTMLLFCCSILGPFRQFFPDLT